MNKNIFDIRKEYLEIIREIDDLEGEISPETLVKMQINEAEKNPPLARGSWNSLGQCQTQ